MGHLTVEYMSRVCDPKGNVKDYFLQDGMGKLRSNRAKCRQLFTTKMASLLRSDVLYREGTLGEQGYRRESSDPGSIVTLTPAYSHERHVESTENLRPK